MGGHAAGEVASTMAVDAIEAFIADTRDADANRTWPFPYDTAISLDGNRLKAAIQSRQSAHRHGHGGERSVERHGDDGRGVLVRTGESRGRARRGQPQSTCGATGSGAGHAGSFLGGRAGSRRRDDGSGRADNIRGAMSSRARSPVGMIRTLTSRNSRSRSAIGSSSVRTACPGWSRRNASGPSSARPACLDETVDELIDAANEAGGPDNITVVMLTVDVAVTSRNSTRYRGLIQSLVARELKARYRGSVLGFFWSFVNPLLLLSIYSFVFTTSCRTDARDEPYACFSCSAGSCRGRGSLRRFSRRPAR